MQKMKKKLGVPGKVMSLTCTLGLLWLFCQVLGIIQSVLGLVGLVSEHFA